DIGIGTSNALSNTNPEMINGYMAYGSNDTYNNGNGSLMRILPVCIYAADLPFSEGVEIVHMASAVTHPHYISLIGCGIYYGIVKAMIEAADGALLDVVSKGIAMAREFYVGRAGYADYTGRYHRLFDLPVSEYGALSEDEIKSSGYVLDTLEAAVWGLLNYSDYKEMMTVLIRFGKDTDTLACVAGGLYGLYHGAEKIPAEWISSIRNRELVEKLCR
ncbi:MAG: ADP-ribosylglycohydrolase family protein, partial [Lachnospiraceae bacterium]|nr:ADP-ribosylglycohydrolase family protein [Lachnospiraceae bacterium]